MAPINCASRINAIGKSEISRAPKAVSISTSFEWLMQTHKQVQSANARNAKQYSALLASCRMSSSALMGPVKMKQVVVKRPTRASTCVVTTVVFSMKKYLVFGRRLQMLWRGHRLARTRHRLFRASYEVLLCDSGAPASPTRLSTSDVLKSGEALGLNGAHHSPSKYSYNAICS